MNERNLVQSLVTELFDGNVTAEDVIAAYKIDFVSEENGKRFASTVSLSAGDDGALEIRGHFLRENTLLRDAGHFYRPLSRKGVDVFVDHSNIEVARPHRDQDLATAHYAKL